MSSKSSANFFTRAYNLARATKLLEIPAFKRVFLFSYFLYKRWHEDPFWALSQRSPELFAGGDVLDIGANIGYTACVFAAALKANAEAPGKVYAFEPDLASFATLEEIIRRKRLDDAVEVFNLAVGSAMALSSFGTTKSTQPIIAWLRSSSKARGPPVNKLRLSL